MREKENSVGKVFRTESSRVLSTLIRILGDFDLAEEAMQEAFTVATKDWNLKGVPDDPVAWLISTAKFRAIDLLRRESRFRELRSELGARIEAIAAHNANISEREIDGDQLRLIFTCCHPAIDSRVQVPLTLREVCGLTTEEIAEAFLTSPNTMAQRIVRGKAKIRDAGIPYVVPSLSELPERLESVLSVIYLVFNEGYSASTGGQLTRVELSSEAIRLGRLVCKLLPDPEVLGLLALMLLNESRRDARVDRNGDLVLLEDQDRTIWDQALIKEGQALVQQTLRSRRFGFYSIQAAISAVHSEADSASSTDWPQICSLYDVLVQIERSPVVELNRSVAIAMRDGPQAGLQLIEELLSREVLANYHLAHSARGELLRRLGETQAAIEAFEKAHSLAKQDSERRFLAMRIRSLRQPEGN